MPQTTSAQTLSSNTTFASDPQRPRELYIDRLRSIMTACVILHHTAITYGAAGGWFYYELHPSGSVSSLLLTMFCATQQAYFMGFFFLLAGYFTPASLERKGYARFLGDRFLRLGVPLLAFIFILGPLTAAMNSAAEGKSFSGTFVYLWQHTIIINGPLWFAQALLMFSIGYCVWRALAGAPLNVTERPARKVPVFGWWLASALVVGAGAVAIRQFVYTGVNIIGLQIGYFSSYIILFALGIAAWRYDWLQQLKPRHAWTWLTIALVAWPAMPLAIALSGAAHGAKVEFGGGLSWPAIVYAFWEPFVAWGLITAWLVLMRQFMNKPSSFWSWLNRRAYAVYIIHPPVLVGVAILAHGWAAPPLIKFVVVGAISIVSCWLVSDPLVRIPGVKKIV